MVGLIIALLWAGWQYAFSDPSGPEVFLSATNFLFWWYVVTTGIGALFMLFATALVTGTATGVGGQHGDKKGALAGLLIGGGLSAFMWALFAVSSAMYVGGAYLLNTAVTLSPEGGAMWNTAKLVIGGLLVLVGIIASRGRSSSKKTE